MIPEKFYTVSAPFPHDQPRAPEGRPYPLLEVTGKRSEGAGKFLYQRGYGERGAQGCRGQAGPQGLVSS